MNTATNASKLSEGERNIAKAISDAVGTRSRVILIDSATGKPLPLDRPDALLQLPQSEITDTAADIPGLLQDALDYITANKTGRTDVWMLSDLQQTDWDSSAAAGKTCAPPSPRYPAYASIFSPTRSPRRTTSA